MVIEIVKCMITVPVIPIFYQLLVKLVQFITYMILLYYIIISLH